LNDLEEISGSSSGAILAAVFLLAKGDTVKLLDYGLTIQTKNIMKPNIKTLLNGYGLVATSKLRKLFIQCFKYFSGKEDMTFGELYELNPIKLHISAFCVDTMKTVYFSVDSTPSMLIIDALCASCAMPFLFEPLKLDGWNYIDGGAVEMNPCGPFIGKGNDILSIIFDYEGPMPEIKDLKSYTLSILEMTMKLRHLYSGPTHRMNISATDAFNFNATQEAKLRLFLTGFSQTIIK